MKNILILFFLLPFCGSAQVNWNQVFGKQRFQQGLGLPSTDTANFRTSVDTSAIVLNRADSTVYFRYKGKWRTLASGGAGTTPNLQQVLDVGSAASGKNINLSDVSSGSYTTQLQLNAINGGAENFLSIVRNDGNRSGYYSNLYAQIAAVNGSTNPKQIGIGMFETSGVLDSYMSLKFASNPSGSFKFHKIYSGSSFNADIFTQIPAVTGTLATDVQVNGIKYSANSSGLVDIGTLGGSGTVTSISQGYGLSASPNPIISTGTISVDTATLSGKYLRVTDTASLSNRIDNKQTGLDILKLIGYGIKAESFGLTLPDVSTQLATTSQQLALYPFYWNKSDSIRGVAWFNRATTVIVPNANYNGVAVYSISGGTLTRETFTANSSTFWDAGANVWKTQPITPYFLPKGLYFFGYQVSGTGTLPTIAAGEPLVVGAGTAFATPPTEVNPNGVRFSSFISNPNTTPFSSIAMSGTTGRVGIPYFLFY